MREDSAADRRRLQICSIALAGLAIGAGAVLGLAAAAAFRFALPDPSPSLPFIVRVAAGARTLGTVHADPPGGRIWVPLTQMPQHFRAPMAAPFFVDLLQDEVSGFP